MYFGISNTGSRDLPFLVNSKSSWKNDGSMVFRSDSTQAARLVMKHVVGFHHESGPTVTNNGSICLYNTMWQTESSISGSGCIFVGAGSFLTLQLKSGKQSWSISEAQTIFLEAPSSHLRISGLSTSLSTKPVIKVHGFGGNNLIDFHLGDVEAQHQYFPNTGRLTVFVSGQPKVEFDIGTGYDSSLFDVSKVQKTMIMRYSGPPGGSSGDSSSCKCVSKFPQAPEDTSASSLSAAVSELESEYFC